MTRKPKAAVAPDSGSTLPLKAPADGDCKREVAEAALRPSVQGAASLRQWNPVSQDVDLGKLVVALQEQATLASSGPLARSEAMLVIQAHTLDAIFNTLTRRAKGQRAPSICLGLRHTSASRSRRKDNAGRHSKRWRESKPPPLSHSSARRILLTAHRR
jgi:hypothetical protein